MKFLVLFALLFRAVVVHAQAMYPHIIVTDDDKAIINRKIAEQDWAAAVYNKISDEVTPYVTRHVKEPEWILSRYLMNRVPGRRYTRVYSDERGLKVLRYEGDAPVPTIRVGSHIRVPVTESGATFRRPAIGELVPYDTSRLMYLYNNETKQREWIDPQSFTGDINGDINDLALKAAIVFWLRGDENYARFAADILDQWVTGAYYQEPILGPCRTGFLDMQTLGDAQSRSIILAYDFVRPYMKSKGYNLSFYENVFEKIASTLAFRGFWNNNWYAAESSTMVFAALSLEDKRKRDYYLQFFLSKDTINGSCGQLALPSTVDRWLTHDGHWKEPGGYHNYPVSNLLISSLALENNGYDVFRKFPALFKASYAMLKYSFPDLTVSAFGDTGRASQGAESLEIGILGAIKYNQPELPEMLASMKKLIAGGRYKRENSGYFGLLCYTPDIPDAQSSYSWPRSGNLDFARYFLQRNGMDANTGLMYGVQGASYNHNHCNGMAMELYGLGTVMGIDAGTGPTYEHPLHVNYFSQWAAHNTVVAEGSSSSVPVSGTAGKKNIGQVELAAMEPMPGMEAVSPYFSFTDTRYTDISTKTDQWRTMAIVRTSDSTGYYVDIYRSDNPHRNDYVYHNIGDSVSLYNDKRVRLKATESVYPLVGKDFPGFRFFTGVKKLSGWNQNLTAVFSARDGASEQNMQVLIPGTEGRTYYHAKSLKAKTAGRYSNVQTPVLTMVDNRESRSRPFIAVFEPYRGTGYTVEKISLEKRADGRDFTGLKVFNRDNSEQVIFQCVAEKDTINSFGGSFSGFFGIADLREGKVRSVYLGEGGYLSYGGYSIRIPGGKGSAELRISDGKLYVSANQATTFGFPAKGRKFYLSSGTNMLALPVTRNKGVVFISVPEVKNALIIKE